MEEEKIWVWEYGLLVYILVKTRFFVGRLFRPRNKMDECTIL
jgi:hypothetical protein